MPNPTYHIIQFLRIIEKMSINNDITITRELSRSNPMPLSWKNCSCSIYTQREEETLLAANSKPTHASDLNVAFFTIDLTIPAEPH